MPYFFSCAGFFGRKWDASSFLLQCRSSRTSSPAWAGTSTPSACLQSIIGSEIVWNIALKHTYLYLKNLVNNVNKSQLIDLSHYPTVSLYRFFELMFALAQIRFLIPYFFYLRKTRTAWGNVLDICLWEQVQYVVCGIKIEEFWSSSGRKPTTNDELSGMPYV